MNMFLDEQELIDLTGKQHNASQAKALRSMGIDHKIRPDGQVIVSRQYIEKVLAGESVSKSFKIKDSQPNWDAI